MRINCNELVHVLSNNPPIRPCVSMTRTLIFNANHICCCLLYSYVPSTSAPTLQHPPTDYQMFRRNRLALEAFGFIGLGQMGARMAPNFFKNAECTELYVFDTNAAAAQQVIEAAGEKGAAVKVCANPAEVAKHCKKVITMLPNCAVVREVFTNAETGIFATIQEGSVIVDSSTVAPKTIRDLNEIASAKKVALFDAPVSGGVMAAASGQLTFMVGSPAAAEFAKAEAFLAPLAKSIVDCGLTGAGQVAKLCNNMILGQHMIAVSEAMLMGTRLGVDPKILAQIFNTSTGRCWSGDTYNPYPGIFPNVPSSNGYKGGFGSALMLKDLGLAMQAADSCGLTVAGGRNAYDTYSKVVSEGQLGGSDFSSVLKYIDETSPKK